MYFRTSVLDNAWSWDTYISPFGIKMWVVSLANVVLSAIVLYATHYVHNSQRKRGGNSMEDQNSFEEPRFNLTNSVFIAFSAQVQQGKLCIRL